jgi:hypothetical protein
LKAWTKHGRRFRESINEAMKFYGYRMLEPPYGY